jgi:hypothetical protein
MLITLMKLLYSTLYSDVSVVVTALIVLVITVRFLVRKRG